MTTRSASGIASGLSKTPRITEKQRDVCGNAHGQRQPGRDGEGFVSPQQPDADPQVRQHGVHVNRSSVVIRRDFFRFAMVLKSCSIRIGVFVFVQVFLDRGS